MNTAPILLSTKSGAQGMPMDAKLTLTGQRLEGTACMSGAGPKPMRPAAILLTKTALDKIQRHGHNGAWLFYGHYGNMIIVKPQLSESQQAQGSDPRTMPTPPGVLMQRALWTTFVKEQPLDYNGPFAMLKKDRNGQDYLALWQGQTPRNTRWLHIPMDPQALRQVLTGATAIREAIERADFVFFVDENSQSQPTQTVMTVPHMVPEDHPIREAFPKKGATFSAPQELAESWRSS